MKALSFYCGEDTEISMDAIKAEIAMEIPVGFCFCCCCCCRRRLGSKLHLSIVRLSDPRFKDSFFSIDHVKQ